MKTGFNAAEIFRKYLWFLLRERKFDTDAVSDVVQLKNSLQLSDGEVRNAATLVPLLLLLLLLHPLLLSLLLLLLAFTSANCPKPHVCPSLKLAFLQSS